MDSVAVVTVNNNSNSRGTSLNNIGNCNSLGGVGDGQGISELVNGPNSCLGVVTSGVEGLDLLVSSAPQKPQQRTPSGLTPVAIVKVSQRAAPPQHALHTLPIVASPTSGTTTVLLNPVSVVSGLQQQHGGVGCTTTNNGGVVVANNNTNNNLSTLMQLSGDQILTPSSTAPASAITTTTVKIEPSTLGQAPVPAPLHTANSHPQQQPQQPPPPQPNSMTNKRNRMEV